MNETCAAVRARARKSDSFFYGWLVSFLIGAVCGLLASRVSCSAMGADLAGLCSGFCSDGRLAVWPLFISSAIFFFLTILCSQLPGGAVWVMALVGLKAFCTAYVFGVFYLLQQQTGQPAAARTLMVHTALLLPAYYTLAFHCRQVRLHGRGRYWFRYRILPILLVFGYLLLAVWLESALLARL